MAKLNIEEPLLLDGQPFVLDKPRPIFVKLAAWLDKQPANKLFSPAELGEQSGVATDSIALFRQAKPFASYWCKSPSGRPALYYGHPRAIERLRAKFTAETK